MTDRKGRKPTRLLGRCEKKLIFIQNIGRLFIGGLFQKEHVTLFSDPDNVPVCDCLDEARIPGGERPTAAARHVPEGQTRQEEHGAMRGQDCF